MEYGNVTLIMSLSRTLRGSKKAANLCEIIQKDRMHCMHVHIHRVARKRGIYVVIFA